MADYFLKGFVGAIPSMSKVRGNSLSEFIIQINGGKADDPKKIWIKISAWRDLAELVRKHIFQGELVGINGRVWNVEAYLDKKGKPGATLEIRADEVFKSFGVGKFVNIKDLEPKHERLDAALKRVEELPF